MLNLEYLKSVLHYNAETGVFTWLKSTGRRKKKGSIAGTKYKLGYIVIGLSGTRYLAHRLAWFYTYGYWPRTIDHINNLRHDNRLINLRDVSVKENNQNIHVANKNSSTGIRGVSKEGNKYVARIYYDGKQRRLGTYSTPEAAKEAYLTARNNLDIFIL